MNRRGPRFSGSPRRSSVPRLVVLLAVFGATACGGGATRDGFSPHLFDPWQQIAPEQAGIRFTGSETPDGVLARERIGHDGVRVVELVLSNATLDFGQNKVLVASRATPDERPLSLDEELVTFDFDRAAVEHNFALLLRGARRVSEPQSRRNRYGSYHYFAAEYPAGSRCVYAWQHVDSEVAPLSRTVSDASIQYRFCDQHRSPEQLIEVFDGIDLDL
jgi:hypothetical protein